MREFKCPSCGGDLAYLGGCSAHETNWYCKDEEGCGWQAWEGVSEKKRSMFNSLTDFILSNGDKQ